MVTDTRARAPRTPPAVRREQIVRAAIDVFGKSGFRQGSLKEVADVVGLTVQGLLHYYPTKESLLLDTLQSRNDARADVINRIFSEQGTLALLSYILRENLAQPGIMRLFVTLAAESTDPAHPAHDYFVERYASFTAQLSTTLSADIDAGRIIPVDTVRTAEHLIALSDGLQLQYLLNPSMDLLGSFAAAVAHLLPQDRNIPGSETTR